MIYPEVAPLSPTVADHLFRRFRSRISGPDAETQFIAAVREKRRDTFIVLDPFVRAGALTVAWVKESLAQYGHQISKAGFEYWKDRGLVEMERHGKVEPLSAQALLIAGMIDPGQRNFLPPGDVPIEDTWCCYVQHAPDAKREVWPVGRIAELPAAAICWTPMRGACWKPGWHPIGEREGFLGCIRFAGGKMVGGRLWYTVTLDDIRQWDGAVADLYVPLPGDDLAQVQALCYPLFHRLALTRLARKEP